MNEDKSTVPTGHTVLSRRELVTGGAVLDTVAQLNVMLGRRSQLSKVRLVCFGTMGSEKPFSHTHQVQRGGGAYMLLCILRPFQLTYDRISGRPMFSQ